MPNINLDDAYILDETGAQVDKVTGLFTKDEGTTSGEKAFAQLNIGTAGSNRNLLDNPWFTVNQRGLTSGTHTTMPADRWKATYGSGSVNWTRESDGCITFGPTNAASHGDLYQQIPDEIYNALAGTDKTVTLSVMMQDGTIYSGTSYLPTTSTRAYIDVLNVGGTSSRLVVYVQASTKQLFVQAFYGNLTVKAVKLEKGSVSTLANDAPPDYAEELMKCNFYDIMLKTSAAYGYLGYGIADSTTSATILIPLPNNMRDATPTITTSGTIAVKGGTSGTHTMTGITFKLRVTGGVLVTVTTTGLTTGEFCLLQLNNASSYINLSADL